VTDETPNPTEQSTQSDNQNSSAEPSLSSNIELWHTHPQHSPVAPHHALSRVERRRAENASIRRWMELGDQALKPDPEDGSMEP
jgi:hypothetical protein